MIAILAIMMLFIAPEVSKTLEHWRMQTKGEPVVSHSSEAMEGMEMSMDMGTMPVDHAHSMTPPQKSSDTATGGDSARSMASALPMMAGSMGMMDDFACGYCQLLVHFPLMAGIALFAVLLLLIVSRTPHRHPVPVAPFTLFIGPSQPRAPPVF